MGIRSSQCVAPASWLSRCTGGSAAQESAGLLEEAGWCCERGEWEAALEASWACLAQQQEVLQLRRSEWLRSVSLRGCGGCCGLLWKLHWRSVEPDVVWPDRPCCAFR